MNKYQKKISEAIKKVSPTDEILCFHNGITIPSYRGKKKAWRAVFKDRGYYSIEEIRNIIKIVERFNKNLGV